MHRSDIFYLYARYTQIYFLGSIIFTRHYARSYRQVVASLFSFIFIFPQGKIEYITYLEISARWSSTTKNFIVNILNLFGLKHGSVSSARQQRRSIIHQWTMFGTDCSGPQLAASVCFPIYTILPRSASLSLSLILFKMYVYIFSLDLFSSLLSNNVLPHISKFI